MGALLWLNGKTRKGALSRDYSINKHVHFVYVFAQKVTVRLWIPVYTDSALVQYTMLEKRRNRNTTWNDITSNFEMVHPCSLSFHISHDILYVSYTTFVFMFILAQGYSELDHHNHHKSGIEHPVVYPGGN